MSKTKLQDQYCTHCGTVLKQKYVPAGFNRKTGKKTHEVHWRCPNGSFLKPHTRFTTDAEGNIPRYD